MEKEKVDLFETSFTGALSVKIIGVGQLKADSGNQEEPLAWFAGNVSVFLMKEPLLLDYRDSPWEIVSFSRKKSELVLKKKN